VITDGEQSKPSFATYPIHRLSSLAPDGVVIPFADGHTRQLPRLTAGPFRYQVHADRYLDVARRYAHVPVKQAVIAASALSLLYPQDGIEGYPRDAFLGDLVDEAEADIRGCLEKGAHVVQVDFTEGRLSVKLDPSKGLLNAFVDLNNRLLDRSAPRSARGSASTPAPGVTRTPPTASTSTTRSCSPRSSPSTPTTSTSSWPARPTGPGSWASSATPRGTIRRSSSE